MNLSRAIGGNFSFIPYTCLLFAKESETSFWNKMADFNNNVGDFYLAFLFNLMGNSLKIRDALNAINNAKKNQYYQDIAH